jgi:hypothetical protein
MPHRVGRYQPLSFALGHNGRKSLHDAVEIVPRITAERLIEHQQDQFRIRHNPGGLRPDTQLWSQRSFGHSAASHSIAPRNQSRTFSQHRYDAALAGRDALSGWCIAEER